MRTATRTAMRVRSRVVALLVLGLCGGLLGASCGGHDYPPSCLANCIPRGIDGLNTSMIVWFGRPTEAPSCQSVGLHPAQDLYADLKDTARCPQCRCEARPCVLPPNLEMRNTLDLTKADCATPYPEGSAEAAVMPPDWDGSCTEAAPYVRRNYVSRLELYAPNAVVESCRPSLDPEDVDASWGTFARLCDTQILGAYCDLFGTECVPPLPEGFRYCLWSDNFETGTGPSCPSAYPDRFELYREMDGCAGCDCRETTPRTCEMTLSAYKDKDCKELLATHSIATHSSIDYFQCLDTPDGFDVRGLTGTVVKEERATCETRGGGQFSPVLGGERPQLLCCAPPPGT